VRKEHATTEQDMGLAASQGLQALQHIFVDLAGAERLDQAVVVDSELLTVYNGSLHVPGVNYIILDQQGQGIEYQGVRLSIKKQLFFKGACKAYYRSAPLFAQKQWMRFPWVYNKMVKKYINSSGPSFESQTGPPVSRCQALYW